MPKKKIIPQIERFELSELEPSAYNPRTISPEALAGLGESLKRFGCVEPIVVNIAGGKRRIIGGHQRFKALKKLHGDKYKCICVTVELSKTDEKLLNLTLNNPRIQGEFIEEIGQYIDELKECLGEDAGFVELRINELRDGFGGTVKVGLTDDDYIPEIPKKPITKSGEIWELGEHRLLCGDSTNMKDVLKLMGKKKAKMCFTSPPYNMGGGLYENYKDSLKSSHYISFNLVVASNIRKALDGFLFWNISYNTKTRWEFIEIFYRLIKECHYAFLENIVWDKERAMPINSQTGMTRQYENVLLLTNQEIGHDLDFCFVGTTQKTWGFNKNNQKGVSNYWRIPVKNNTQLENHKACFPVELPCKAIDLMSGKKDIVIEPFCGSGTTIIACQKLERRCFAIELDPIYCDVAVKRWEEWTGEKARRVKA